MKTKEANKMTGLTLLEILFTLAIFGLILGAIYGIFMSQQEAFDIQAQLVAMEQTTRSVTNEMLRELRMAGFHAGDETFVNNLAAWVPSGFIPKKPMDVSLDANPKVTLGSGDEPDMISFLAVLATSTNPTTLSADAEAGNTQITLSLSSAKTDQQYNTGDLVHIGLTSEYARVAGICGRTLTIDTDPNAGGNQGLARHWPAGTELGEIMVVTYAVFNELNDPSFLSHEEGHPVLKRKVNAGGFQPLGENITDMQITGSPSDGRIRLFLASQTEREVMRCTGSAGHRTTALATRVCLRNAGALNRADE
jgi:hypothetical protein